MLQFSGFRIAPPSRALQQQHGLDQRLPGRAGEQSFGLEHAQLPRLPTIAALVVALCAAARFPARQSALDHTEQAKLVFLDLGQQVIARSDHALEEFF